MWNSRRVQPEKAAPDKTLFIPPGRRRWRILWSMLTVLGLLLALGWHLAENFHPVVPQIVYRSGQLGPASLQRHLSRYQIRSVINLRGENLDESWYREERAMAARCGVRHLDMPTDSTYPPLAEELRDWIRVLKSCDKPALIHCQSGIDRTGLVAVVSVLTLDPNGTPAKAREQLTWRYGHLPWRANHDRQLAFVEQYSDWLRQRHFTHTRDRFVQWATDVYVPEPEWVLQLTGTNDPKPEHSVGNPGQPAS